MSTLSFAGRTWRACTVGLIVSVTGCLEFNSGDGALVEEVASRPSDVEPSDLIDMPEGFLLNQFSVTHSQFAEMERAVPDRMKSLKVMTHQSGILNWSYRMLLMVIALPLCFVAFLSSL